MFWFNILNLKRADPVWNCAPCRESIFVFVLHVEDSALWCCTLGGSFVMTAFNFLERESGSDFSPLSMMSPRYQWWTCVTVSFINSSWTISAPEMILHALTIIMVPLATPEQGLSACQHGSRFCPKWIGSNTLFKHAIWANACSSLQQEALSVLCKAHSLNRQAGFVDEGELHQVFWVNGVQTPIHFFLSSCIKGVRFIAQYF